MVDVSSRRLVWSASRHPAQNGLMAKKKPTVRKKYKQPADVQATQPPIPGCEEWAALCQDPVLSQDSLRVLFHALESIGIDVSKPPKPEGQLFGGRLTHQMAFTPVTARTDRAEQMALVVEHAEDARKLVAYPSKTQGDIERDNAWLREKVRNTLLLRRAITPPPNLADDRRPLFLDGEIVTLVKPEDDARSAVITFKLPRCVVDRLRDCVCAMMPHRTMAGIASLGISQVVDTLEAHYLLQTGHRFPKRATEVLTGGRPRRTTATSAAKPPTRTTPSKGPKSRNKNP